MSKCFWTHSWFWLLLVSSFLFSAFGVLLTFPSSSFSQSSFSGFSVKYIPEMRKMILLVLYLKFLSF